MTPALGDVTAYRQDGAALAASVRFVQPGSDPAPHSRPAGWARPPSPSEALMTYPDSGAPADPREELEAIRRRLVEITPTHPRGDNGLLVAGSIALASAFVVLLIALAVASTQQGAGQAAVLVAGFCVVAGFGVLGLSLLRRWQSRARAVRRERLELLARHDTLSAEMGEPRGPAYEPAAWPNRTDRLRMVVGLILAALVLFTVVVTILVRVS
jgi:hypothetical protein